MITANLLTASGDTRIIEPVGVTITIDRDRMRMGAHGPTAIHARHSWKIGDERFLVMKIETPVTIRLESASNARTFGPFENVWVVDGMILHDLEQRESTADFDDDKCLWISPDDKQEWERVIFTKA